MDVDNFRKWMLAFAEILDAYRIFPRIFVISYGYLVYKIAEWYIGLKSYIIEGCVSQNIADCIVSVPTTQHAVLVTAIVGIAGLVFGFYANSGRKWNEYKFSFWNKKKQESEDTSSKAE